MLLNMIKIIPEIMIKIEKTESWFRKDYSMKYNPFTLIHNVLGFLTEILIWFNVTWSQEEKNEVLKSEHTIQKDKVITITRWGFIQTFSIIEYTIKEIIKKEKFKSFNKCIDKWEKGDFVSFYSIIKIFHEMGKINDNEYNNWNILRKIRNCLVHNNAITDEEISYELNNRKIVRTENYMLLGDIDGLIILIEQISKLYSMLLWNLFNSIKYNTTSK